MRRVVLVQGQGPAVRRTLWALQRVLLAVCSGALKVGWCQVALSESRLGHPTLLVGALAGPLARFGLLGPGGRRAQVVPPVPVGVTGRWCASDAPLSEACLKVPDVGALVPGVHFCGGGFAQGGWVGVLKGRPALRGPPLGGRHGVCWVEVLAKGVGCSFLPDESVVEPAASAPELVCHLLWCRLRPRPRGCYVGDWEVRSGKWRPQWCR